MAALIRPFTFEDLQHAVSKRPAIGLAAALMAGIAVADAGRLYAGWFVAVIVAAVASILLLRGKSAAAIAVLAAIFGLGGMLHSVRIQAPKEGLAALGGERDATVVATIADELYRSGRQTIFVCDVAQVTTLDGGMHRVSGRALVTLARKCPEVPVGSTVEFRDAEILTPAPVTNWYQRDRGRALARRRIHTQIEAWGIDILSGSSTRARIASSVLGVRARMLGGLRKAMPGGDAETYTMLLAGMVFGEDAARVDDDLRELFRRTGTIHLLVVSGAQVSIIVFLILSLRLRPPWVEAHRYRPRPRWWHIVVIGPVLLFFGLFVGMGPSITRSLLMCGLWLLAELSSRRYDLASAIAVAALILCLSDTSVVFDVGAQLTFMATIGVATFLPDADAERVDELRREGGLRAAALGTLGAWVFVTPLIMHYFYSLPFLGMIANVVAVPLSVGVVVVGLLASISSLIWLPLCTALCWVARVLMVIIRYVNVAVDHLPLSYFDCVYLSAAGCVIWIALGAGAVYVMRSKRLRTWGSGGRGTALTIGIVVACAGIAAFTLRATLPRPARIVTFDVGEGQCTLIETSRRRAVLIDAGGRGALSSHGIANDVLLPYLVRRGYRKLDALVLSHPDGDHYAAAANLMERMPGRLVLTNGLPGEARYRRALEDLQERKATVRAAHRGTRLQVPGAEIEVICPPADLRQVAFPLGDNNASLVLRVRLGDVVALLPGDLEDAGMRWLLANRPPGGLRAHFLQIPHHGRDSAGLPDFFEAARPAVAVVSRFGPPVLRAGASGCASVCGNVLDTETHGAVIAEVGSDGMRVKAFLRTRD